jgi:DnaD/phage-associated family protein
MAYRLVYTEYWKDPKVMEEMTPGDKLFYLYILTNPCTTSCGIYMITKKQMAFELGYSEETVNTLIERFEKHYKLIKYNAETRELAIRNWGRYNLHRGGKPVIDCLTAELSRVKDKSLIDYILQNIKSDVIKVLYESFCDRETSRQRCAGNTNTDTNTNTSTNTITDTDANTITDTHKDINTSVHTITHANADIDTAADTGSDTKLYTGTKENTEPFVEPHRASGCNAKINTGGNSNNGVCTSFPSQRNPSAGHNKGNGLDEKDAHNAALSLLQEFEKIIGHLGVLSLPALKLAVIHHGQEHVKAAGYKALESRKFTMSYINGILRTWAKEGYKTGGETNGIKYSYKGSGVGAAEARGSVFKPHEPTMLTDEQRRAVEAELL